MDTLDYDVFFHYLKIGSCMNDTCFYFTDEPGEPEHYLGYVEDWEPPYWVGLCDIPNGCSFATAEELVQAPVYQGRSLKERWDQVRIVEIEALSVDYWLEHYPKEALTDYSPPGPVRRSPSGSHFACGSHLKTP